MSYLPKSHRLSRFFVATTFFAAVGVTSGKMCGAQETASSIAQHQHAMPMNAAPNQTSRKSPFAQSMTQSMDTMNRDMVTAPMNGDPDHDFASMMIPHHQGAIDMAKGYLLEGKDPTLRRLAQEIVVAQAQEISVMKRRLDALQTAASTPSKQPAVARQADSSLQTNAPKEVVFDPPAAIPVSSRDRVYTGDQTSNTVSVINPATNTLLGVIRLGDPVPGALSALYRGQLLVHGLGFSPDHRTIAVVSIGSNSVTFIDTATNTVKGTVYIGRSPHEAFFTPDGKELWVCVRGEDYLSVIDAVTMKETRRVQVANGPGMVLFRPDGQYAFVPSSFTPELAVIDTKTYQVVARVPQDSPFSPNLAVSRDGSEVWFTLKDSGKTQVMSSHPPFRRLITLDTGPITNHVSLVDNANGKFAYITVGGENVVKVYRRDAPPQLVASIPTGDLPHGIWASGDGTRVYVGLENQDAVIGIDTLTNKIIATIPVGQQPQALIYVPGAVPTGDGADNLMPGVAENVSHLRLAAPPGSANAAGATVSVNSLGALDLLQAAVTGLKPGQMYTLWLVSSRVAPFKEKQALVTFKANLAGAQVAQAVGPLRQVLAAPGVGDAARAQAEPRFLIVTPADSEIPVLIQAEGK